MTSQITVRSRKAKHRWPKKGMLRHPFFLHCPVLNKVYTFVLFIERTLMAEGVRRSQQGYSLPHLSPKKPSLQA
ncbi:hypothetical protein PXNS11_250301 [Stutzerimonas xanthomarina]|nr:hypothetical protein PXNS11_250301 [Stutzerimonas xanthomarina]